MILTFVIFHINSQDVRTRSRLITSATQTTDASSIGASTVITSCRALFAALQDPELFMVSMDTIIRARNASAAATSTVSYK